MCLPQLYKHITLCSYDTIRYKDDRAEGRGSASPFSMGLNALVTKNIASLVKSITLQGVWKEHDSKEYSSAGRIPDDAMMLNIAVRAAVDRCTGLDSFKWDLNTKLLSNVYSGLANLPHLQNLHIRFPSSRSPRPIAIIPPMPHLQAITITHIDPLCYPDDISTLLYASKKLDTLNMHWSPRMRDEAEPSVQLQTYFRHNIAAKQPLKIKRLGIYNLFAVASDELQFALDHSVQRTFTMLNCFGADEDNGGQPSPSLTTFFDSTWSRPPKDLVRLVSMRHDRMSRVFVKHLGELYAMERLYFVNSKHVALTQNGQHQALEPSPQSTSTPSTTPSDATPAATSRSTLNTSLRDSFLDTLISNHGISLKHLILPDRWPLSSTAVARLFRACPNLTQLALALSLEFSSFEGMRMLLPFLKNIRAIRLLIPTTGPEAQLQRFESMIESDDCEHEEHIGRETAGEDFPNLRYVGLGWKAWELGGHYEKTIKVLNEDGEEEQKVVLRRKVTRVALDVVKEVEIWKMDSLEVI